MKNMYPARARCVRAAPLPIVTWFPGRPLSAVDPNHHLAIVNAAVGAFASGVSEPRMGSRMSLYRIVAATARRNAIDPNVVDLHGCVEGMWVLTINRDGNRTGMKSAPEGFSVSPRGSKARRTMASDRKR